MSLPKIVESEPWLEEDDDFQVKSYKNLKNNESIMNFATMNKLIKTGVYAYLIIRLISRSKITSNLFMILRSLLGANKYYSPIIISAVITITSLLHKQFLN